MGIDPAPPGGSMSPRPDSQPPRPPRTSGSPPLEPHPEDHVLAVDLGTSGPKVALVSTRGEVETHAFRPTGLDLGQGGAAEQDPEEWWTAVREATREVLHGTRVPPDRWAGICCTAQWSGTVCVDAAGKALGPAVIWMDTRGAPDVRRVLGGRVKVQGYGARHLVRWLRLTGGLPGAAGKDPLAHILFLQRARPERFAATHRLLEPKDYLNLRLTGRARSTFDTVALYWLTDNRDIRHVRYHPDLLRTTGIPREKLPSLVPATRILGSTGPEVTAELGLPRPLPVVAGSADLHTAAVGSGAVEMYRPHLYVGTSSWLLCHVPTKRTDVLRNMAALPSALPDRYLLCNEQETAGACLNWLRDAVFFPHDALDGTDAPEDTHRRLDALAASVAPGAEGVLFLPWLYGERTPVEDAELRGAFLNLSLRTRRATLVRAVLEGVALNTRWLLQGLERFTGHRMDPIHFIGGGARSDTWSRIFADVLGRRIVQVADPLHANVRGAAFIGAVGLGLRTWEELPRLIPVANTWIPDPGRRALHDRQFHRYLEAWKHTRPLSHRRLSPARLSESS